MQSQDWFTLAAMLNPKLAPAANMMIKQQDQRAGQAFMQQMSQIDQLARSGDYEGAFGQLDSISSQAPAQFAPLIQKYRADLRGQQEQVGLGQVIKDFNEAWTNPDPNVRQQALAKVSNDWIGKGGDASHVTGLLKLLAPNQEINQGAGMAVNPVTLAQTQIRPAVPTNELLKDDKTRLALQNAGVDLGSLTYLANSSNPGEREMATQLIARATQGGFELARGEKVKDIRAEESTRGMFTQDNDLYRHNLGQQTLSQPMKDQLQVMNIDPTKATAEEKAEAQLAVELRERQRMQAGRSVTPPPESVVTKMNNYVTLSQHANAVTELTKRRPDLIGPVAGTIGEQQNKYIGKDAEAAQLWSSLATIRNNLIRNQAGLSQTETELKNTLDEVMTGKESPASFLAKLEQLKHRLEIERRGFGEAYKGTSLGESLKWYDEESAKTYPLPEAVKPTMTKGGRERGR